MDHVQGVQGVSCLPAICPNHASRHPPQSTRGFRDYREETTRAAQVSPTCGTNPTICPSLTAAGTCANRDQSGHTVKDCVKTGPSGFVSGCPKCNASHMWEDCLSRRSYGSRDEDYGLLVVDRIHRPPLMASRIDWFGIWVERGRPRMFGLPWSVEFSKRVACGEIRFDVSRDYKSQHLSTHERAKLLPADLCSATELQKDLVLPTQVYRRESRDTSQERRRSASPRCTTPTVRQTSVNFRMVEHPAPTNPQHEVKVEMSDTRVRPQHVQAHANTCWCGEPGHTETNCNVLCRECVGDTRKLFLGNALDTCPLALQCSEHCSPCGRPRHAPGFHDCGRQHCPYCFGEGENGRHLIQNCTNVSCPVWGCRMAFIHESHKCRLHCQGCGYPLAMLG